MESSKVFKFLEVLFTVTIIEIEPFFVNFNALLTKFNNTCLILKASIINDFGRFSLIVTFTGICFCSDNSVKIRGISLKTSWGLHARF